MTCTNGTNARVKLDQGLNANKANTYGSRVMAGPGSNYLGYEIYSDPSDTTVWNANQFQNVASTGSPVNLTAYGKLPANQSMTAPGSYTDSITVTASF